MLVQGTACVEVHMADIHGTARGTATQSPPVRVAGQPQAEEDSVDVLEEALQATPKGEVCESLQVELSARFWWRRAWQLPVGTRLDKAKRKFTEARLKKERAQTLTPRSGEPQGC